MSQAAEDSWKHAQLIATILAGMLAGRVLAVNVDLLNQATVLGNMLNKRRQDTLYGVVRS
jgi:hypothetical protein